MEQQDLCLLKDSAGALGGIYQTQSQKSSVGFTTAYHWEKITTNEACVCSSKSNIPLKILVGISRKEKQENPFSREAVC